MKQRVGPWTMCEGGAGAYRALEGTDGEVIANRVAFIEKSPRIRIRPAYLGNGQWQDFLNWAGDGTRGDGPEDQESRAWCDEALVVFGYEVPDPVIIPVKQDASDEAWAAVLRNNYEDPSSGYR